MNRLASTITVAATLAAISTLPASAQSTIYWSGTAGSDWFAYGGLPLPGFLTSSSWVTSPGAFPSFLTYALPNSSTTLSFSGVTTTNIANTNASEPSVFRNFGEYAIRGFRTESNLFTAVTINGDATGRNLPLRIGVDGIQKLNAAAVTFNGPIDFTADQTLFVASGQQVSSNNLRFNGPLSSSSTITKSGSGELSLSGSLTNFTGTLNLAAGTTFLNTPSGPASGTVNLASAATLRFTTDTTIGRLTGTGTVRQDIGTVFQNNILTIGLAGTNAADATFSGDLANAVNGVTTMGLTLAAAPTRRALTLAKSGGATYTGPTNIGSNAFLIAAAANSFPPASSINVESNGTLDLGGFSQSIRSLSGSGRVISVNPSNALTTLTIGTANASSTFSGTFSAPSGSTPLRLVKVGSGMLTLTGANTLSGNALLTGGILSIGDGGTTGSVNGLIEVSPGTELVYRRSGSATVTNPITLLPDQIFTPTALLRFIPASSSSRINYGGFLQSSSGILRVEAGTVVLSGNTTNFGGNIEVFPGTTLELGSNTAFGSPSTKIILNNAGLRAGGAPRTFNREVQLTGSLTLGRSTHLTGLLRTSGNITITLNNSDGPANDFSTINNLTPDTFGILTINAGPNGVGTGGLTLTGNSRFSGYEYVQINTRVRASGNALGYNPIRAGAGSDLQFTGDTSISSLALTDNALASVTTPGATLSMEILNMDSGTRLNLNRGNLLLRYRFFTPIASIISRYNAGLILSESSLNGLPTYLAISDSADLGLTSFDGIPIDVPSLVAKYTYVGDANLDGQVDALDYERIDLAIGNTGVFGTAQGDLNYDGNVDALDYEQVDLNIGNGVGLPLSDATPLASVFIPEPAILSSVALVVALLPRRRR